MDTLAFEVDQVSLERLEQKVEETREGQQAILQDMSTLIAKVDALERTVGGNGGYPLRDRIIALETQSKMLEKSKAGASAVWVAIIGAVITGIMTLVAGIIIMIMQTRHDDEIRQNHEKIQQLEKEKHRLE